MRKPLLSFIVPIYNVEDYLDRCIQSLLRQGLDENIYEIILVNDGSTDSSLTICQNYRDSHENIRVISQENQGAGPARNTGIREAHGDYLCFVDSDDYLTENKICSIIKYCDGQNKLIRFWCKIVHQSTRYEGAEPDGQVYFQGQGLEYLRKYGLEAFCWNYLYKRDFLERNNLQYSSDIFGEDFLFINEVLFANPNTISLAYYVYCYVIRDNTASTTKTKEHSRKCVENLIGELNIIKQQLNLYRKNDHTLYEKCMISIDNKMINLFSRMMTCDYTLLEYKRIVEECISCGLLPLSHLKGTRRLKLTRNAINLLSSWHVLYYPAQYIYKYFFLTFVHPQFDRNK